MKKLKRKKQKSPQKKKKPQKKKRKPKSKMRKLNKGRALSRPKNQRKALLNAMATNLFIYGKIKTTEAKAKELRVVAEKMITRAKKDSVVSRRIVSGYLAPTALKKLFGQIALQYTQRNGGYTRIVRLGPRKSDGSKMVIIE